MADQRPPRTVADDRDTVLALLQYTRESMVRKVVGVDDEAARRELVGSGTTLLWLLQHVAEAETLWVLHRFAGQPLPSTEPAATVAEAVDRYRTTWNRVDDVVAESDLDDRCRGLGHDEVPANLRWVLVHLLEETARHAGHADVLRELLDGSTGR